VKRALVTGAAGFVGASLARRLVRDGHEVHLLVRPGADVWRLSGLGDAARLHEASLEDADALRRAMRAGRPEWIFHLGAYGAYSWQDDAGRMIRTNVDGFLNLVEPKGIAAGTFYLEVPNDFTASMLNQRMRTSLLAAMSAIGTPAITNFYVVEGGKALMAGDEPPAG